MKKENKKKNIEKISKVIEEKKIIPKEIKEKISSKIFENIIYVALILLYLGALNIGMSNIPTENYITDLRVFSMLLLVLTIIMFELAYKKDKGELWIHGIELMVVAIFTTYLQYLYSIYYSTFGTVVLTFALFYLIYYSVKILIEKRRIVKEYNKSLIDIGEIVKR